MSMLYMILEPVCVLVPFGTIDIGTSMRLLPTVLAFTRMAMKHVIFESVGILVRLSTSLHPTYVRSFPAAHRRCRRRVGGGDH